MTSSTATQQDRNESQEISLPIFYSDSKGKAMFFV